MAGKDPHSFHDDRQPTISHLSWHVDVDFDVRILTARADLTLADVRPGPLQLDTRAIDIDDVRSLTTDLPLEYELGAAYAVLGRPLTVMLGAGDSGIRIHYRTSPDSTALQWLTPAQTAEGTHPFVYSQCQTIHARSMVPLQDTPVVRMTVDATISVPAEHTAVMAAQPTGSRHTAGGRTTFTFVVRQPIPAYLLAFAVGRLDHERIGPRSVVWAEPSTLAAAAWEFAEVEQILQAAETVLGPFPWDRADLLVLPPSYPYGGMENPQLMWLTPTLITGDRSLVSVLSHEIAHHWTGDMVTCASLEHFWMNEGFTVFAERKITALLHGDELAELQAVVGRAHLDEDLRYLADKPELTRLRLQLDGIDPDVSSSWVALEKGYLLLRAMEESVGTTRFAQFLRDYLDHFRFRSVTSEEFVAYASLHLPGAVDYDEWVFGTGLHVGAPIARSLELEGIRAIGQNTPVSSTAETWHADQWQAYLAQLEAPLDLALMEELDARYSLTGTGNHDILGAWLLLGLRSGYPPAVPATLDLLAHVGRLKHLKLLYSALADRADTREIAVRAFAENRGKYHPIAVAVIEARLADEPSAGASQQPPQPAPVASRGMKALVLSGGAGTRLRPITHTSAKQLVPVANKPVLFYGLEAIRDAGITDVGIIVGDTHAEIEAAVGDGSALGIKATYIPQTAPLGLAHCVLIARDFLGDDDFVMYLGDNFIIGGITDLVDEFKRGGADAQILLTRVANPQQFGIAELDEHGAILRLVEKPAEPKSDLALVGVYMFAPTIHEAVNAIKPSSRGELEITDAIQWLVDHGKDVRPHLVTGYWKDTGRLEDMLECNRKVLESIEPNCLGSVDDVSRIIGRVVIEEGASIERSTVRGPAIIGRGTRIVDSYVGPFTSIYHDCVIDSTEVEHSIVLESTTITGVSRLEDSLIGKEVEVSRSTAQPRAHRLMLGDHSKVSLA